MPSHAERQTQTSNPEAASSRSQPASVVRAEGESRLPQLENVARSVRRHILKSIAGAGSGHPGGSLWIAVDHTVKV